MSSDRQIAGLSDGEDVKTSYRGERLTVSDIGIEPS